MAGITFTRDEIKQKIRKLKKLEVRIRFGASGFTPQGLSDTAKHAILVWDEFFDLYDCPRGKAKYSLCVLAGMEKDELKEVISEFFFHVYYRYYKENGIVSADLFNPGLLAQFGLPCDADKNAIKKRFRELAKKYHPDTGGDSARFIELMESYKKLVD
jgi:hypothetical protein